MGGVIRVGIAEWDRWVGVCGVEIRMEVDGVDKVGVSGVGGIG